jgi:hypothetical protein
VRKMRGLLTMRAGTDTREYKAVLVHCLDWLNAVI